MKIVSTKDIANNDKFRIMLYGQSGIGKTQLISTIPGKALILNLDKGLLTLKKSDVDYVSANTWAEVLEFLNFVKTKECSDKYSWIVYDSITALMRILYSELVDNKKLTGFEMWKAYGDFATKFLTYIRDQQQYHTLSIFEEINSEDDSGMVQKTFGIQGKVGSSVPNFFDEVLALRIGKEGKRYIQTASANNYIAKDRSKSLLPQEEPDLNVIMKKIQGI